MNTAIAKKYFLAIRTSNRCNQKLRESIFFSQREIKKQKIPPLKK
jgi:hypothetical protein